VILTNPETKLKWLIGVHQPENRNQWALEWKMQGKKVVGVLDSLIPEEIFHAAGMLPYRIIGSQKAGAPNAQLWRPVDTCRYCNHVLESLLTGELDFLDGIVFTDWDDDERRLYDVSHHACKPLFNYIVHVPHQNSELAYNYYTKSLRQFISDLEAAFRVKVSDEALWEAIKVYDEMRGLLLMLYEWRKREVPPASGAEVLGIVLAAFFMPKDQYVSELKPLIDYLKNRKTTLKRLRPRLLVASDRLDNLGYMELIEDEGALIAMDDLDTGSRYFWQSADGHGDPLYVLAKRYISKPACPRMYFFDKQVEQVAQWVKEYRIDGVLHLPHLGSHDRLCCNPYFLERLGDLGIPVMTFLREYRLTNVGQLKTRIGAFLENLKIKV
jgi:benzoyl-CoA reductase/2-hydroxyglutaryl-CoA dehydratase subunit BcrC/BadD/HgdB